MKITVATFSLLLVLALCSQYAEGCLGFYTTFAVLASRSPELLELDLLKYNPTTAEIQAFKKIQECYQESPLKSTFLDASFLISISLSQECLESLKTPFF
ncbi:androgen-binding protein homolog [Vombatus ursinus]|uniref:androgen-binding protein homolog n=1 Tax=Vombatus ursinus TaxID=29139 RepID=UPI000FFDB5C7|nr:androgen-binding protein homolog [Vombatus ursinus]XP_027723361.1 androgen-binding protein homolog [Vombatus ursinus]